MLRPAATPPHLATLILLSALAVLSLNMFLPSLAHIAGDFGADYGLVNLSIAGYAGMTALLQLVMGPLSDRFGRRPVILAALAIFILASLGCAFATDVWTFLACRLLQAAIIAGYSVSLAVIRDTAEAEKAASLMGYVAMGWAVAPMLGPLFGGALEEFFGWRASFWAFTGFGVAVLALVWTDLGETNRAPAATFAAQLRSYPELFGSRRFWGYSACMAFSVGSFYIYLGCAPLVAAHLFQMSPAALGVAIGSSTAGFMLGNFLSGRFAARRSLTAMMIAGRLVASAGLAAGLVLLALDIVHVATIFGPAVFMGIGNGLTFPSANAGAMSVRPTLTGSAAGLAGALTVAGGALLAALAGAILTEADAAAIMLAMMLLASLAGLGAALYVRRVDRREAAAQTA
ncbi:Bcr/CflA family efflux MFS transporter [Pelagibius sp. 7325]|uniref:Bcr/CflA family efflux MFS transporter n=1 Tax=Pelagibius sp. 7325 TaxID=3131994 RepID=UPI0030EDC1BF